MSSPNRFHSTNHDTERLEKFCNFYQISLTNTAQQRAYMSPMNLSEWRGYPGDTPVSATVHTERVFTLEIAGRALEEIMVLFEDRTKLKALMNVPIVREAWEKLEVAKALAAPLLRQNQQKY